MPDAKLTNAAIATITGANISGGDYVYLVRDPSGTPQSRKATVAQFLTGRTFGGRSTFGDGTFTGMGVPSGVDTPTVVSIVKGTSASPNTNASPTLSIADVFSGDPLGGAGRVTIHTTLAGAASGDVESLSVWARQTAAVNNGGLIPAYFRVVAEVPGTNSSHFAGAATAQWFVRTDATSWEFDVDNQGARLISGATNANPIVITTTADHTYLTGDRVTITGVLGNTAANGTRAITVLGSNSFSIPVAGNGAYISGGVAVLQASQEYGTAGVRSTGVIIAGKGLGKHTAGLVIDADSADCNFYTGIEIDPGSIDTTTARAIRIPNATSLYSWNDVANASVQLIGLNSSNQVSIASGGGATVIGGALTIGGAVTFPDDIRQTFNPGTTNAGLNVGSLAGNPSGPSNGDVWYNSSAGELTARIAGSNVALGAGGGGSTLPVADTQTLVKGSADATKLLRFEIDGFTTGTTRVATWPDSNLTVAGIDIEQTFTAEQTFDSDVTITGNLNATGDVTLPNTILLTGITGNKFQITAASGKAAQFNLNGITNATTRVFALPDFDGTLATLAGTETLTNKTLTTPTIGSFANANHNHTNSAGGGQLTDAALSAAVGVAKGGTSFTSFTKGDILVASGSTTLVKLGVGTNGHVLTADSGETSGVKWAAGGGSGASLGANTFTATQTINPAVNTQAIIASSYSLTGSNTQPILDLSGTWNTSGAPALIKANVTNTASDGASLLMDLQVGGSSKFKVRKDGKITLDTIDSFSNQLTVYVEGDSELALRHTALMISSDASLLWTSGSNIGGSEDTGIARAEAALLKLTNASSGGAGLQFPPKTSTPTDPSSSSEGNIYIKGGKLIAQYNDGGTVRYKYLDLTGTGSTWTHTTSAP